MENLVSVVLVAVVWFFGAYKGWKTLTGVNEWLDRKQTSSYIVKGFICMLLGIFFAIGWILKLAFSLMSFFFRM